MLKKYFKYLVLTIAVIVVAIIDYKISLGIIIGYLFSLLHNYFLKYRVNKILDGKKVSIFTSLNSLLGILIMAIPLLLSFIYPSYLSWVGVLIGLLYEKFGLYISAWLGGKHD